MFFGGNLVRQPAFVQLKSDNSAAFKTPVPLTGSDFIMNQSLFFLEHILGLPMKC